MATIWIIFTTFIGWFLGWLFTDDSQFTCGLIGFCVGFMTGFITPIKGSEH